MNKIQSSIQFLFVIAGLSLFQYCCKHKPENKIISNHNETILSGDVLPFLDDCVILLGNGESIKELANFEHQVRGL